MYVFQVVKERVAYATSKHFLKGSLPLPKVLSAYFGTLIVVLSGGAREDRTPDLLRARQALSQLSYGPIVDGGSGRTRTSDLTLIRGAL